MAQSMVGEMSRSTEQTDGMDSEKAADVPSQGARGTVSIQADPDPNERPPTVVDRYFSKHYRIGEQHPPPPPPPPNPTRLLNYYGGHLY